ncbi:MAG: hypothetical protein RL420_1610 [Pseudomonadota bacterium]
MAHAMPKRSHGLSTQNTTRCIGHGAADDQRQTLATGFEIFFNRKQCGFGVERVEKFRPTARRTHLRPELAFARNKRDAILQM